MFCFPTTFRFFVLAITTLFFFGCADVGGRVEQYTQKVTRMMESSDAPEPIATSLEQMPDDAAMVARAIQQRVTGAGRARVQNVRFAGNVGTTLTQPWSKEASFIPTGAQLYSHQANTDDSTGKATSGRLDFEEPLGRKVSVRYEALCRTAQNGILIEEARVTPVYPTFPEPLMFVVPAEVLPADASDYPNTYGELLQFVGARAVPSTKTASPSTQPKDYVIFVFFLDQASETGDISVNVSDKPSGINGYNESTRYVNFGSWRVALLAGRFTLFGDKTSQPIYVKAVFTPGEEVGFLRRAPKLVGLFNISGSSP